MHSFQSQKSSSTCDVKIGSPREIMSKEDKKDKKRPRGSSSTGEEDKILEKLFSIQTRIDDGFTKMEDAMTELKQELKQDILAIKNELDELKKSTESAWVEINTLKEENESIKKQMASTLSENAKLSEAVNGLKDRVIKQEDYSRRENLRILNIPENQGETNEQCCDKVKEVVTALGLDPNEIRYHAIHRVGKQQQQQQQENLPAASSHQSDTTTSDQAHRPRDRPRPILVRFVSRMDADAVWGKRKELLQNPALSSVFIDKDLSAESAKIRGKLRAALRKSKELNISRAFIKGNKLFVNSSSYTVDNIPEYLLPSKHGNDH